MSVLQVSHKHLLKRFSSQICMMNSDREGHQSHLKNHLNLEFYRPLLSLDWYLSWPTLYSAIYKKQTSRRKKINFNFWHYNYNNIYKVICNTLHTFSKIIYLISINWISTTFWLGRCVIIFSLSKISQGIISLMLKELIESYWHLWLIPVTIGKVLWEKKRSFFQDALLKSTKGEKNI